MFRILVPAAFSGIMASGMPIWNIAGSPLAKRNTHIRATAKIEIAAARVNSTLAKPILT